ncbi:MAG: protein-disulfide reductase DsbD domain-containing protein, partial [Pyrinomonadaceae bacterium]
RAGTSPAPTKFFIGVILTFLFFTACSSKETTQTNTQSSTSTSTPASTEQSPVAGTARITSTDVVKVTAQAIEIPAGGSGEADLKLLISGGYHVNANPATEKYLIPTEAKFEAAEGITPDKPVYPSPVTKKFSFSEKPLAVYESEAVVKLPLRAASTTTRGAHTLKGKLQVQACDDQACYRPGTIDVSVAVTVK